MYEKLKQILIKFYGNYNALSELWKVIKPEKRSLSQNSLYWLWLTCIQQETGNDKNDLHEYFKNLYIPSEFVKIFGKMIEKEKSTTNLTTNLFKQYLDKIQIFAQTELNINLPNPYDLNFNHFKEYYEKYL